MPCLANQLESKYTGMGDVGTAYDPRNYEWANEVGRLMKEKAVFGVPVTVHNPLESHQAELLHDPARLAVPVGGGDAASDADRRPRLRR
jgi:hypothetical protein